MTTTRRSFLLNGARVAGGLMLAGCVPSPTTTPSAGAPIKKDLVIGTSLEVVDGQPFNQSRGEAYGQVFSSIYDTITGRDANYKLVPRLATSWRTIDPLNWEFKFRTDVKFHNGDPLTAADAKWSIERTFDPAAKTIYATSFASVEKIDLVDDQTLRIKTKAPDPFLADKFSVRPGYVVPMKYFSSVGVEGMNAKPVGSGPYMFKERASGVRFTLARNPGYWRGNPDADSLTWLLRPDEAGRLAALRNGEVELLAQLPFDQVDAINAHPATKAVPAPDNGTQMYIINSKAKPLDNKLVRQAMSLAVDREGLNKTIGKGLYQVANSGIAPFEFAHDPKLPKLAFDPTRAKALLQQAGYANEKIVLESRPASALQDQAIAEQWKAVGLNIDIQQMDDATRARKVASLGFLGLTSARFASLYGDPDSHIWRTLQPGGSLRYWTDAEFDRLGVQQASSTDPAVRLRNWQRMTEIMLDQVPLLYLWQEPLMWGVSKRIDVKPSFGQSDDYGPGNLKFNR